ncbi:amidohydrolase family protein [Kribbella sp. NPDC051952]|uniref:amidohydrolase family protein n=1 Tax=Kribbella sp. NPDC051952 TaxID=3154851 RepID=UPI003430333C
MSLPRFVDAHVHLWDLEVLPYPWLDDPGCEPLRADYLPGDLRADSDGLDLAATVHVQAEMSHALDPVAETSWLAELAEAGDPPVPTVCVGYADLRRPDLGDVLARHQEYAFFRGIRQEAWFDPTSTRADVPRSNLLDDPRWVRGLGRLAARGLSFDLLVWDHQLAQAVTVFRELPELTLVLEHLGVPPAAQYLDRWRSGLRAFADQVPWAKLKLSAIGMAGGPETGGPLIREAIEIFGPHRCLFASNFPVERPSMTYRDIWATYDAVTADLSPSEREAVFAGTALSVYRIEST